MNLIRREQETGGDAANTSTKKGLNIMNGTGNVVKPFDRQRFESLFLNKIVSIEFKGGGGTTGFVDDFTGDMLFLTHRSGKKSAISIDQIGRCHVVGGTC